MAFVGITDANGQPVARVNHGINGKPERYLLGREVVTCGDYMKNYADTVEEDTIFAFIFNFKDYAMNSIYDIGIQKKQDWDTEEDHPRTCGENDKGVCLHKCLRGSPPHLRGKLHEEPRKIDPSGITPAPAGKTSCFFTFFKHFKDHPRTCGENQTVDITQIKAQGSPPHLRGKLSKKLKNQTRKGITPAPAGKTFSPTCLKAG